EVGIRVVHVTGVQTCALPISKQRFMTLFDFAYQGFGDGVEEDALPVREFAKKGLEFVVCSSFSKNFGLYNERVGALTLLGASPRSEERRVGKVRREGRWVGD